MTARTAARLLRAATGRLGRGFAALGACLVSGGGRPEFDVAAGPSAISASKARPTGLEG